MDAPAMLTVSEYFDANHLRTSPGLSRTTVTHRRGPHPLRWSTMEAESTDIDDHLHCAYCVRSDCDYPKCVVRKCPECKRRLHPCKLEDHLLICLKAYVRCPNACAGCPVELRRERIGVHLTHCCASVIYCAMQWNRRILSNYAKRKMKRVAKGLDVAPPAPQVDPDEIDLCAALVDQDILLESYKISRSGRKHLTDFQNPFHPLMPLRLPLEKQASFPDEDSSDEENRIREIQIRKRKSPFENCYLCRVDPASQHLHTLGNFVEHKEETVEILQPKISLIPPFYARRNLYLEISRDHLSAFSRKGENLACVRDGVAMYTFCCNECFRRDEYSNHYELSHMEAEEFIGRCPLFCDGCSFFYRRKSPTWGTLKYSEYLHAVVHCPPEVQAVRPYEGISLDALPAVVLFEIAQYLDSGSLRCLSATNRHIRQLCFQKFLPTAMVYIKWEKADSGNWSEKAFMWEFSKCQERIRDWTSSSSRPLSNHLYECKFNVPVKYPEHRIPILPMMIQLAGGDANSPQSMLKKRL